MSDSREGGYTKKRRDRAHFWSKRTKQPSVTTIVIDTTSLVDITHPTIHTHPIIGTSTTVLQAAQKALVGADSLRMIHLSKVLEPVYEHPVATYSRSIAGTSWHDGAQYRNYWIGEVDILVQRSDLTENEREALINTARHMGSDGQFVYAVGTSVELHTKDTDPSAFLPRNIQLLGFIYTDVRTYPDLTRSLIWCREQGIRILYASSDAELVVSSIAHRTKLVPHTQLPQRYHTGIPIDNQASCFAELTKVARQKLIEQLDPSTTFVTDLPLPDAIQTITHY